MNPVESLFTKLNSQRLFKDEITLPRGHRVIQAGELEKYLYFVHEGALRVFFIHEDEEYIIRLAYQGDFVSALDSFISQKPTSFYIETLRSSRVSRISIESYMEFIHSSEENTRLWNSLQSGLIYDQLERERDLLIPSPQERYERVLSRSPKLFQEVPLKYIAAYLRMTPETLSRIMKH